MSAALSDCSQALARAEQRIYLLEQELAAAQAATARASQQLTTLSEAIPEGLLMYDHDDRIVIFSEQLHRLLELPGTAAQWLGQTSAAMVPLVQARVKKQDLAAFRRWTVQVHSSPQRHSEQTFTLKDGRVIQIDYVIIGEPKEDSRGRRLLCFRDVTERQEITYELAQQRAFYENILDCLPAEIVVIDPDLRLRYVNPYAEPNANRRTTLLGQQPADFAPTSGQAAAVTQFAQACERALTTSSCQTWEDAVQLPDGQMRYLHRYLSPVQDASGQTYELLGFGADITLRHLAEEHTRALFAALPDTILVVDANGRVRDAKLGDTTLAMPEDQLKGSYLKQLLPTEALAQLLPCLAIARRVHQPKTCVFELHATDGTTTYHTARLKALTHSRDVLISLLNTTPQELARRQLLEQQEFVRQVVDNSPTLIYVRDAAGNIIFSNLAFDKMKSHSQHVNMLKAPASSSSNPTAQELAQLNAVHTDMLNNRQEQSFEMTYTMTSGEERCFQMVKRPLQRADGEINVLTIATDITETKRARQRLELSQKKYHDLVHYSPGLICTHDLEGNVLTVNPAVERCLGLPAAKLVGKSLSKVVLPNHLAGLQEYLEGFAHQQSQRNTLAIRTTTGEKRYLDCHNYLVPAANGKAAYVVVSAFDITDALRAERALQQAKREVEQGARAKEQFLANMSHEIRTPLNGVMGMAGLLAKTSLNLQQQELVDTIDRSGQHLLTVISDVLDMAKISAGMLQLDHTPFDVCEAVLGVAKPLTCLAEAKGVYLAVECATIAQPHVLGDVHRLNQVLLNLLSNAVKFTNYGSVTVGSKVLAETPTTLTLRFWVRDTGIGIAPEQQQRIFDTFTQASPDTARNYGGSGLGLSISQHLVQRMGGTLMVDSQPGAGSTFSFTLDFTRVPDMPISQKQLTMDYEGLRGRRILLAEDNRVNQRVATLMLENWGVTVDCVSSGSEALILLDERMYDLVLMDIQMPGLSGVETTTILRRHPDPRRANLPVVALTANAFRRDREQYLAAGMTACMTKPFQERRLYELLLGLLDNAAAPIDTHLAPQTAAETAVESHLEEAPVEPIATETAIGYSLDFLTESADGNPQFVDHMVNIFLKETPVSTHALQTALVAKDWQTVANVAHSVKPSLTLLQVNGLTTTLKALESKTTPAADREAATKFLIQRLQSVCQSMAAHHGAARVAG